MMGLCSDAMLHFMRRYPIFGKLYDTCLSEGSWSSGLLVARDGAFNFSELTFYAQGVCFEISSTCLLA
jgi:hypothetical protein